MPIRALLFDFDGLIVDTESPSLAAWRRVYAEHGQELSLERWSTRKLEHELTLVEAEQLRPGVAEYLADAERLGLRKAIVSSSERGWIDRHLRRLERLYGWEAIVTADGDRTRAKPSPALYLEALDLLDLDASEAIALEDSPNGVRAAKAAGLWCVGVPNAVTAGLGLDAADLVLESLASLPLADLLDRLLRLT